MIDTSVTPDPSRTHQVKSHLRPTRRSSHCPRDRVSGIVRAAAASAGLEPKHFHQLVRSTTTMSKARHARPRPRRSRNVVRAVSVAGIGVGLTVAGTGAAFASGDYTVKAGDTLSEIAAANGTSWRELARLNNLENPDLILIGQELSLSGAATSPRRSDRVEKKAERRGTKTEKFERRSRKTDRSERSERRSSRSEGGRANLSGAWAKVAQCESGGNPRAVNPSGKYHGLFQFDRRTWRSVGGSGKASDDSASEQLMRAKKLYAQRGASPWPNCGRYLR
jgi:LysM repeat protein